MRKYYFRLETLKRVRKTERDQQRIRLAEACQANEILQQQQAELSHQKNQLHQQQKAAIQGPQVDIENLSAVTRYEPVLRAQENALREQQVLAAEETERCRENLVTANRHVRTLELLDTRRHAEHCQNELRQESKQLDEAVTNIVWQTRLSRNS
jgi:flagellar export protein FliJ